MFQWAYTRTGLVQRSERKRLGALTLPGSLEISTVFHNFRDCRRLRLLHRGVYLDQSEGLLVMIHVPL